MRFARTEVREVRTADRRGRRLRDKVTATAIMLGETRIGSIHGRERNDGNGPAYAVITTNDQFWDGFAPSPYFDRLEDAKDAVRAHWRLRAPTRWA